MSIKVIAFDFDGVFILDSDGLFKKNAWKVVLQPWVGKYEPYLKEANAVYGHGKSGGRKEILRYVFERMEESKTNVSFLVEKTSETFDLHVQSAILSAGLVPEVMETLTHLSELRIPLYLNSGTQTSALKTSATNLGIDLFFNQILGSTPEPVGGSKIENLTFIATQEKVHPKELLFIGDSESDYEASVQFGSMFVGYCNYWNNWDKSMPFPTISNFREIITYATN